MNYDKILIKIFFDENKKLTLNYNKVFLRKNTKYINIKDYVENRYIDSLSNREL